MNTVLFETGSPYVAQDGLELTILWDHNHRPPPSMTPHLQGGFHTLGKGEAAPIASPYISSQNAFWGVTVCLD